MACLAARVHVLCRRESRFAKPREKAIEMRCLTGSVLKCWISSKSLVVVPLPEGQEDDVYQEAVRALNTHFHVQKNAAYERHVLRQLQQEPGVDMDSFVLRLRKQARQCGYGDEELEFAVRDQLIEKVSSQGLRTKLFEVPNIQLAAALTTARAWETANIIA